MNTRILLGSLLAAATMSTTHAGLSLFEEFSRKSRVELYGFGEYLTGWEKTTFLNQGGSLEFDSAFGGGIGTGFSLGDCLDLNTDFSLARLDVTGRVPGASVTGDSTLLRWNVNLDYNILKRRFTPLITGGAGIMHFNGEFGRGAEFSETDFTWRVGAGARWDITDHLFAKAIYRVNWVSLEDSDHSTMFHSVALMLGYAF